MCCLILMSAIIYFLQEGTKCDIMKEAMKRDIIKLENLWISSRKVVLKKDGMPLSSTNCTEILSALVWHKGDKKWNLVNLGIKFCQVRWPEEHMINFSQNYTTQTKTSQNYKKNATQNQHVMIKQKLWNLITTGNSREKRTRGKPGGKYINRLNNWHRKEKYLKWQQNTKDLTK